MMNTAARITDPKALAEKSRNAAGKIEVRVLYRLLTASGRAGVEAVDHMIALGCPTELAWDCYYKALRH